MASKADAGLGRLGSAIYLTILVVVGATVVWAAVRRHAEPSTAATSPTAELSCEREPASAALPVLPEASGLALSMRTPGLLWSLNDSSAPVVIALDQSGRAIGRVRITGADVNNWEDISVAPCAGGSCLYVADTGNGGGTQRNDVVIYRVPEPLPGDKATAPAEVFNAAYPADEDHEAEAVFAINGQLYLVTKGHPSLLFGFPLHMPPGSLNTLERLGEVPTERLLSTSIPRRTRITDAETTPDGRWVALRTNEALLMYRADDLAARRMDNLWYWDLRAFGEPQGEGVAMSNDGEIYLASEGGGGDKPGTFARARCALPQ
jgi:hypothetical protein